jgi:hypothetical protein
MNTELETWDAVKRTLGEGVVRAESSRLEKASTENRSGKKQRAECPSVTRRKINEGINSGNVDSTVHLFKGGAVFKDRHSGAVQFLPPTGSGSGQVDKANLSVRLKMNALFVVRAIVECGPMPSKTRVVCMTRSDSHSI